MLVYNRYREKYGLNYLQGRALALAPGLVDYEQAHPSWARGMFDVVGYPNEDNVLLIGDVGYVHGFTSGKVSSFFACKDWAQGDLFYNWDFIEPVGVPTDGEVATKVVAGTSPDRPEINLPIFLYELKDIPKMVRQVGKQIKRIQNWQSQGVKYHLKEGSSDYLAMQFGWSPLIKDLTSMLDVMFQTDQRVSELDRLYSKGGLRRSYVAFRGSAEMGSREYYVGPLYGAEARVAVSYETRYKKWGTVRYRPTTPPAFRGHDEKIRYARSLVTGFSQRPATLWEAMPWSWLIDWFSNCGDYIAAHSNAIPLSVEHINVMTSMEIVPVSYRWTHNPYNAKYKLAKVYPMRRIRMRTPTTLPVLPSFHLPFLSGKQLSILSALAIQRFGK